MAILNDLPTTMISQIVEQLHPRLYIDFIRYLPAEVCLKILGYLDPVSLINVARSCRAWYDLALDWKLWEQLYYMEGWKAKEAEITAWEKKLNAKENFYLKPSSFSSLLANPEASSLRQDVDTLMEDAGTSSRQEAPDSEMTGSSIFGHTSSKPDRTWKSDVLESHTAASSATPDSKTEANKGKDKATSTPNPPTAHSASSQTEGSSRLPQAALWMWDHSTEKYKINWRYLYTLRRRLESNWELGRFTNFQLPDPEHPEEGHGECIYSLQYNEQYLVSGSRDRSLKVWDMETRRCVRTLTKHRGSVLCLQFDSDPDEDIIVSGSSDSDVIIWKFSTGQEIQTLRHAHRESVLNVKFDKRILVTCSKDKTIKIFNRKPIKYGELGYQEVDPVPRNVNYGYAMTLSPDDLPKTPAWTQIGCLEGHSAAVNAVQIHGREVVSASGDRHIKVWDWPTQSCTRTIVGHTKGIACVQYDGRRIVSGSSDNEVKVFDRQTGLEVASLRSHSNLVRTVQAGFGDLPYSVEDDAAEAKKVDVEYFKAIVSGQLAEPERRTRTRGRRAGNAGSKRPEDICAYGAKLPPGGGGGKYGRIVSGSYDTSIIIWRRDKEGIWKDQHHLKQEEGAAAAVRQSQAARANSNPQFPRSAWRDSDNRPTLAPPHEANNHNTELTLPPLSAVLNPVEAPAQPALTATAVQQLRQIIDHAVSLGPQALGQAITTHPTILTQRQLVEDAIDRVANPITRSQFRQLVATAYIRWQFEQARQRREGQASDQTLPFGMPANPFAAAGQMTPAMQQLDPAQRAAAAAHEAHAHLNAPAHGVHLHQVPALPPPIQTAQAPAHRHVTPAPAEGHDAANPARVFKLQFDARRIICCSQTSVIVGWDFCNGNPELEEASRFFGPVQ